MHFTLLVLGNVVAALALGAIALYAPFARRWQPALAAPFCITLTWSAIRLISSVMFRELDDTPLFGVVFAPFGAVAYAAIIRGIKLLLFKVPVLAQLEIKVATRFFRRG